MYHTTDDPRSVQSSKMLFDGLAMLMRDQAFDDITVTDLVKAARVGRATFYRNFDSIEDVLQLRCDQVCEGLLAYYVEYQRQHGKIAPLPRLKPTLRYFDLHSDIVELLMKANQLDMLTRALRREAEPFLARFGVEDEYRGYIVRIRFGVLASILAHWIETGKRQTPDELADNLGAMMQNIVLGDQFV